MEWEETKDWNKQGQPIKEILNTTFPWNFCVHLSASLKFPQLKLRLWKMCPLDAEGSQWGVQDRQLGASGVPCSFFQIYLSLLSVHFQYSLENYSQDINILILYLIHSVLLDSILTTKALGIICRM